MFSVPHDRNIDFDDLPIRIIARYRQVQFMSAYLRPLVVEASKEELPSECGRPHPTLHELRSLAMAVPGCMRRFWILLSLRSFDSNMLPIELRPRRIHDFTVPRGTASASAISECDLSSKKASAIAWRCMGISCARQVDRRADSSARSSN